MKEMKWEVQNERKSQTISAGYNRYGWYMILNLRPMSFPRNDQC